MLRAFVLAGFLFDLALTASGAVDADLGFVEEAQPVPNACRDLGVACCGTDVDSYLVDPVACVIH